MKRPAISILKREDLILFTVSGEIVGAEDGSGGYLFIMRVMLKLGAVNSEGLSASSRKLGYLSATQKKACVEYKL